MASINNNYNLVSCKHYKAELKPGEQNTELMAMITVLTKLMIFEITRDP